MEDEQNREENEEQSLGKQAIDVGKQVAEQAAKNAGKKIAKKIGAKILAVIAPYIIPVIAGILIVVIIVGGLYAIIDHIRENSGEIQTAIATFLVAGDNGPIAPSPNEMVDLINKELEKSGLDKDGLYLGNGIQTDIYLYKFMTASLATQLPYIKDSTAKTLTDILKQTLVPGVNAIETFKSIVGQDVQGIVKIKRQTGNENKDLTYKKYEDFLKLIEENNENNQSSALDYFSIDESWMLCVAKKSKTTTKNPDNTQTEVNTITEVKIPYQTMISKYSIPFEFFITLQQTTQNAEYVSAVADMIQDGEIELTIFDQTEVIETTYTYRYKVRRKWIETQKISRETYKTEILSRSFIRTIDETKIASGKKRPTEEDSGKHDSGKNEEKDKTPSKPESSSSGKNEENNDNPNKGESSNTDKNEENNQKGENENLDKNEENGDASDDDVNKVNPVQKDETGEEQTEITVTIQEVNSIMASVTKADVWVIDQKATYIQDDISPEYPLGEDGITTDLGDEEGAGEAAEGTWQVERSETTKQTVTKEKWKLQSNIVDIDESEFLGLWKNAFGMYIPDTKPKYDPNGILVKYELPGKWLKLPKFESPIEKLESSEELLYDQLERSEYTQTHAQLMRYLIQFYKTKGEVKLDISDILSLFDVSEFTETSWIKFGTGYWWPLKDTSQTRITSGFGYRGDIGVEGASKNHKGIDIGVPVGSEVIAVADGTVEVAGYSSSAGNWIKINHSNGVKTVYMHNSTLLVSVGQTVKQGDVIALSGNTGNSGGPHLHFGVEVNGEYVNPLDYVSATDPRPTNVAPDVPASVEVWETYIVQAFAELGYECTDEKVNAILRQISTESGGNQSIIQGIKDSNSGKPINIGNGICPWCSSPSGGSCGNTNIGHGLLQFIPTTFYSNMIPGHTNIFNGYDQICTCITMLEKRSGSYTDYIGKGTGWG